MRTVLVVRISTRRLWPFLAANSVVLAALSGAATLGCSGEPTAAGDDEPVGEVTNALAKAPQTTKESRANEAEEFLRRRSQGWRIVETREAQTGEIIDYVAAETLYPGSPDAPFAQPPPARPATRGEGQRATSPGFTNLQVDPSLRAPAGTVAMLRPQFKYYIENGEKYGNFAEYMRSIPTPTPNHIDNRLYAWHQDNRANIGTGGYINLWYYNGVGFSEMSLMQTAVFCGGPSNYEAIEIGFQILPSLYGDFFVHLFTYFATNGQDQGAYTGGYNETVGFKKYLGATLSPGDTISSSWLSSWDGTQLDCQVETELYQGNWWVYACGEWLGYYPTNNSTSVSAGERIPFNLIDDEACSVQWFGEVFDPSASSWTNANMGGGGFAFEGWARAGYMREPFIQLNASTWDWVANNPLSGSGYDAGCYTQNWMQSNGGTGWARWFYLGGPGGCD